MTLLEALIAILIAAVALTTLSRGVTSSLELVQHATQVDQAVSRAQSHLMAAEQGHLAAGQQSGDDGGGYRWRTTTKATATATPALIIPAGASATPLAQLTLFTITTTISWHDGDAAKSVSLATQAIGPAENAPP